MRILVALLFLLGSALGTATSAVAAPPPLSIYGQLPGLEEVAISPSGDRVAMIGTLQEQRRLVVVDKDNNPILSVPIGEVKIRDLYWGGDNRVIIYKSDTVGLGTDFTADKAELFSAFVIPLDGQRKGWWVFAGNPMVVGGVRGFYGVNQRSGKWYGYFGGITLDGGGTGGPYLSNTKPALYEVDLDTGSTRQIGTRADDGLFRRWAIGPDGAVSARVDYVSKSGNWSIQNGSGERIVTGYNKYDSVRLLGLGRTDGTISYSQANDDTGEDRFFEVPLAGGTPREILANTNIEHAYFDRRSKRLIGYAARGDIPVYHLFDTRQQKVVDATLKAFPGHVTTLVDWNDTFDRLVVTTEGGDDPQCWWLVDIKTGSARPIGQSYMVPEGEVGPVKMVRYKASDGTEIAGVLTLPPHRDAKKLPVVIFPHGGPGAYDRLGFDWWAQAFSSRGYAVLQPNFRGSTGYGAAFQQAGNGEWGRKMQSDISDGLTYLAAQGIADPKRACIMGASYGGYAALAGVALQQGIYRCAVSVAGVSDVAKLAMTDRMESGNDPELSRSLKREIGSGRDLAAISPIRFVDKVTAPVLLIHGKDDTRVHYEQSKDMAAALKRAGKTVEFVTLPGEDHWLSKGATRLAMLQAAVAFVEKHNPPDGTNAPEANAIADAASTR